MGFAPEMKRADDDKILSMIALRCRGLSCGQVAQRMGVGPSDVSSLTARVLTADLLESGEKPGRVRSQYWVAA